MHHKMGRERPVLVLVGLHQSDQVNLAPDLLNRILENCHGVLAQARASGIGVAFVRRLIPPASISEPRPYPAWYKGFEPKRNDMVFDVTQASCYSNSEFAQAMEYNDGNFAIAGLFGETTCLSTAIDAHHRGHRFTYLSDASGCGNNGPIPAALFHDAITQVMSIYGNVMARDRWMRFLMPARGVR
jgi:nicotinamidase-related amidase